MCALRNLFDDFHVARSKYARLFVGKDAEHALHVLGQSALIMRGHGYDVVHAEVAQHARLNLYFLRVDFPFHFVAGVQFVAVHYVQALEHLHAILVEIPVEHQRTACFGVQPAAFGLFYPFFRIAIAVEHDGAAGPYVIAQHAHDGAFKVNTLLHKCVDTLFKAIESLGNGSVQHDESRRTVGLRAKGAKLKAVSCKGKGRSAVAVGVVDKQLGNLVDV